MKAFADEASLELKSGNGGNGCIAFRREKYVPMGGPSGGDGGRGGDIVFEVRRNLRTLSHLRFKRHFKAQNGQDGMGRCMHGKDGEDEIIPLPPGCVIKDEATGEVIKDFEGFVGRWTFLKGGNGGWGNVHYKGSINQAPRFAQPGKPGQEARVRVELNIIADIGLVGFPNAGKSSLLDYFTNARPAIAPYPFTTKIPNLGVLSAGDTDIVLADIPGIIEGAHEGHGLGIRFLKHIARTKGLAFVIDCGEEGPERAFGVLLSELKCFSSELADKPRIVVASKMDLEGSAERLEALRAALPDEKVYPVSVFSREGLSELAKALFALAAAT